VRLPFIIQITKSEVLDMRQETQKPLKEKLSISLDPEVIEGIRRLAEMDDRNFSSYVNRVLKEHLQVQATIDRE
jgi:hypothetical protein